jgi:predicted nucleic acid-binding protein
MIILDTSIWIEYLKRNDEYRVVIDDLLRGKKVLAFDFIFGELLQGAKEHEKAKIIGIWEILPKANVTGIGFYAGKYSMENKLKDKGIGLIDCAIIYATMDSGSVLWTLDRKILDNVDGKILYNSKQEQMNIDIIRERLADIIANSEQWIDALNDTSPGHYGVDDWEVYISKENIWVDIQKKTYSFKNVKFNFSLQLGSSRDDDAFHQKFSKSATGQGEFTFSSTKNDISLQSIIIEFDLDLFSENK